MKFAPFLFLLSVSVLSAQTNSPATADLAQTAHRERFTVTSPAFGAVGNGVADDTAAIQAAFNACAAYNASTGILGNPPGGIVEFPGGATGQNAYYYVVSSTINAYDGCLIEGAASNANTPTQIRWKGPAVGTSYSTTGFIAAANGSYPSTTYTAAFPQITGKTQNRATPYIVTFTGANSLSANQWVSISGCTTPAGLLLNRAIGQVASATGTSAVVAMPSKVMTGTYSDSCTLTTASVVFAFDASAHFMQSISNIEVTSGTNLPSVDFLFGSRLDTGSRIWNVWAQSAGMYGYYFTGGAINVDFDKGWRAGTGIAGIYWRVSGDNLELTNGTSTNSFSPGGMIVLDNSSCNTINLNVVHVDFEANHALAANTGVTTIYGCPSAATPQLFLNYEEFVSSQSGSAVPFIYQTPANDADIDLTVINSSGIGSFTGIPSLQRYNIEGSNGYLPFLAYAPSNKSIGANSAYNTPIQLIGDVNVSQLWQYGIHASDFLYSDPALAALPNGTTLFAGQIIAPPSYWSGANGKRYALDVVYKTGTTGTPNGGATTCSAQSDAITAFSISGHVATITAANKFLYGEYINVSGLSVGTYLNGNYYIIGATSTVFTAAITHADVSTTPDSGMAKDFAEYVCSSSTDLSTGQAITVGSNSTKITSVTYPPGASTPFVRVANTPTYNITEPLSFTAPVLGPEIQFPTKSAAAPATLAWSQGDMEQNAAATANGVAAWVNVAGGTPGTWAGIPLGDSKGKIDASQLSSARSAQAFCAGTASSSTSLLLFGAGTAQTTCTQSPGPQTLQQILLTTAGSLSNLAVRCGHQGSQPSSGSFSVWDLPSGVPMTNASSGTNTGLTVTIGNSPANANKTLFDTLRRFDYAAGDMIRIQFTTQANETLADCTASVNY